MRAIRSAIPLLLLLSLLPDVAQAVVPEMPGDGIDNGTSSGTAGSCPEGYADAVYSSGCDLLLPEPDKDGDGYTSDGSLGSAGTTLVDCDDTDRTVYPGVHVADGCSGSDYKTCQGNGTFTSCQAGPLCEATGTGECKYIDCSSGDNANSGTYASPYATWGKVSGGSGGALPSSPFTLGPGDAVYLIGSGSCTTAFNTTVGGTPDTPVLFDGTVSGDSSNRILLARYPGSTALLTVTDGTAFVLEGADYYTIRGFKGSTSWSSKATTSFVYGSFSDNTVISDLWVTRAEGNGDNNNGCIAMSHSNNVENRHNFLGDCVRAAGNVDNTAAIMMLDDEGAGEGADHYHHHNVKFWTTYSNTANGSGLFGKHGANLADVGENGHRYEHNYIINPRNAIMWAGSGLRASGNLVYWDAPGNEVSTSVQRVAHIFDNFTGGRMEDNRIEGNTFINGSMLYWQIPTYASTAEKLTFKRNVIVDNDDAYSYGNNEGVVAIAPYGSSANKTYFEANSQLDVDENCYFNTEATALVFPYFVFSGGGSDYSFADWKSTVGQDASSFNEDPVLDTYYRATATNCENKGFLLTSEEGAQVQTSLISTPVLDSKKRRRFKR